MKRDVRLQGLSHDHHHSLVLARRLRLATNSPTDAGARVAAVIEAQADVIAALDPHFAAEEEVLVPALREARHDVLAERLISEHRQLRSLLHHITAADALDSARTFADMLEKHVRFEERELFPLCEQLPSLGRVRHLSR